MKKASRTLQARIHFLQGQLDAVERMLGSKRTCVDVLHQISAVRAGLEEVTSMVFERELQKLAAAKKLNPKDLQVLIKSFSRTI